MREILCGSCGVPVPQEYWNMAAPAPCPACAKPVRVFAFPVLFRPPATILPQQIVTSDEASCYNHPHNRAVVSCESCGRFLCALCDLEVSGSHICPSCFQEGRTKELQSERIQSRVNHDTIALALVTLPMLICSFCVLTTPMAVIYALIHWKGQPGVLPRSRWRVWATLGIAVLQIASVIGFFVYLGRRNQL